MEHAIQKAILEYLAFRKIYTIRVNSGSVLVTAPTTKKKYKVQLAPTGTPDIVACVDGKFVAFEVKRGGQEAARWRKKVKDYIQNPTPKNWDTMEVAQYRAMKSIERSGGYAHLVSSVEEVEDIITLLRRGKIH